MTTTFPTSCSYGHAAHVLNNDSEVQSHLTAVHKNDDAASVTAAFATSTFTSGPGPQLPQLKSAATRWGINLSDARSIPATEVCGGVNVTIGDFQAFLSAYGASLTPTVTPDLSSFMIEFFRYVLTTAASEDASTAGGFMLRDSLSKEKPFILWSSFFKAASRHFDSRGSLFKPRRFMRTCDSLFWEFWNDGEIQALSDIRSEGTQLSRRWNYPDGTHPPAYVVVPELFSDRLTDRERKIRLEHQHTVNKVAAGSERSTYSGFDQAGQHLAFAANKAQMFQAIAGVRSLPETAQRLITHTT